MIELKVVVYVENEGTGWVAETKDYFIGQASYGATAEEALDLAKEVFLENLQRCLDRIEKTDGSDRVPLSIQWDPHYIHTTS